MKTYEVYVKGDDYFNLDKIEFIQQGFSIFAAIFKYFWSLYHRMWFVSAVLFLVASIFYGLDVTSFFSGDFIAAIHLLFFFALGMFGFDLLGGHLRNKGYRLFTIVVAQNKDEAKRRYIDNLVEL